jgi:cell division protein CrgA
MPKSRVRKKAVYTPPPTRSSKKKVSPPWVAPLMVTLFLIGIAWLVTFYITGGDMPGLSALGNWSLLIGFGFIVAGFAVSTQWR